MDEENILLQFSINIQALLKALAFNVQTLCCILL